VAASLPGRVVLGPRAGPPVRRLRSAAAATAPGRRAARLEGFRLHADVAVPARRRDQLEEVCRYILRPPLALERLTESTGGQRLYQFRRPWSDGSTALVLDPLELLERLAALVPRPRRPWLAYHGLLAPRARWRSAIVPKPAAPDGASAGARSPGRWPWARLLRRVFAVPVLVCEHCGGPRRILGAVTEPHAVRRRLAALGRAAEPPPGDAVPAAGRPGSTPPNPARPSVRRPGGAGSGPHRSNLPRPLPSGPARRSSLGAGVAGRAR
jgi:hypothetical protein